MVTIIFFLMSNGAADPRTLFFWLHYCISLLCVIIFASGLGHVKLSLLGVLHEQEDRSRHQNATKKIWNYEDLIQLQISFYNY